MKSTNNEEVVFESETQAEVDITCTGTTTQTTTQSMLENSCNLTPSTIPMTATRLNPFAKTRTPLNDSSKSIINELEEKISSSGKAVKEKDSWKPTPTRKLTKTKVSNGTPTSSIGSFFNK